MAKEKKLKGATHEAKMVVLNENPKKFPAAALSAGFKYVEVEITDRTGEKTKQLVPLHEEQIKKHLK